MKLRSNGYPYRLSFIYLLKLSIRVSMGGPRRGHMQPMACDDTNSFHSAS